MMDVGDSIELDELDRLTALHREEVALLKKALRELQREIFLLKEERERLQNTLRRAYFKNVTSAEAGVKKLKGEYCTRCGREMKRTRGIWTCSPCDATQATQIWERVEKIESKKERQKNG